MLRRGRSYSVTSHCGKLTPIDATIMCIAASRTIESSNTLGQTKSICLDRLEVVDELEGQGRLDIAASQILVWMES